MLKKVGFSIILFVIILVQSAMLNNKEKNVVKKNPDPPFWELDSKWADSLMKTMTLEERIGQLIMIKCYSNKDEAHKQSIVKLIQEYKVGGACFFQGSPFKQAQLCNYYQSLSRIPLLIAMDAEWGLGMRLDSTISFPRQGTLGAIKDNKLLYDMGVEVARQLKRMGVHVNFAPVVDVNNNPKNPVIGTRSFGENKINVSQKSLQYMLGMQDNHVLACAKHFPGHGDTDKDSHKTLPVINHNLTRLDTLEMYPFKKMIEAGIGSVMIAHLSIPAMDAKMPSSLSPFVVDSTLKKKLGFKGLVFTDGLGMQGVAAKFTNAEIAVNALLAGNDILLLPEDTKVAVEAIKKAIADGKLTQDMIDNRCKKILMVKRWSGLHQYKSIELNNLTQDLNNNDAQALKRKLKQASQVLLKNSNGMIPVKKLDSTRIASLCFGDTMATRFQATLQLYTNADFFFVDNGAKQVELQKTLSKLDNFDLILVNVHLSDSSLKNSSIYNLNLALGELKKKSKSVVVSWFGNMFDLTKLDLANTDAILLCDNADSDSYGIACQSIFGGRAINGSLSFALSNLMKIDEGIATEKSRLGYALPEEMGIQSSRLLEIESMSANGIREGMFPGCQILLAYKGMVVYFRSFGSHTYEGNQPVLNTDLYDLASVTKVSATIPCLMKLTDEGKFNVNAKLKDYWKGLDTTNKGNLFTKDVLTHQAGITDWIPFYKKTMHPKTTTFRDSIVVYSPDAKHNTQICDGLYILDSFRDSVYKRLLKSPLGKKKRYKYSDIGYYIFHKIIEDITKTKMDEYLNTNFYKPLGAYTLGYNPMYRFPKNKIAPTELDRVFRQKLVHGYVHDPGAALLGGVAGHAGLFSNANDLAKLWQMYLWKGVYGGERYLTAKTIELFTSCPYCKSKRKNRRGYGFDKPIINSKGNPANSWQSASSYHHTGFTGTQVWADPSKEILYVFLSNRVYPSASNQKIIESGIRTHILKVFYDAI